MRKYLTRFKLFLLVIFTAVILVIVAFNIILFQAKDSVTQAAGKYFNQKVSVGNIFYLPPNFILLKKISVSETTPVSQKQLFSIPTAVARFSFSQLLKKRHLSVFDVRCYKPNIDYDEFCRFLRDNFAGIMEFIRNLPKQDIGFSLEGATLGLAQKNSDYRFLLPYLSLTIKNDSLSGSGSLCRVRQVMDGGLPLHYRFTVSLAKEGLNIENLEFIRENLYLKLWGNSYANALRFKGFAFINTLFKDSDYQESSLNAAERIGVVPLGVVELPQANLYILDIDCQLAFALPSVEIQHFAFSLNNTPVMLKGNVSFSNPFSLDLMFSAYPVNLKNAYIENLKGIELQIKGILQGKVFNGDGMISLDFIKKKKTGLPLEETRFGFKDLTFNFARHSRLNMRLGEGNVFCQTDTNAYRISLTDFNAAFNLQDKRFKFIEFYSLFYGGFLKGKGRLDMSHSPPTIASTIRLRSVAANKLDGILIHFAKVYGRLASQMYFSNHPSLCLKGGMSIQEGYLKNFEFFKWLADFFDLPSLKKIDFSKAFTNFLVDDRGAGLRQMRLESEDVDLNGYFTLGANDLVSSKLSLGFSRELMRESPKFTPLLRLLKEKFASLTFDFQLSGNLHAMNFQWLESDFKRRLQDLVPNFIERKIEKNIEEMYKR